MRSARRYLLKGHRPFSPGHFLIAGAKAAEGGTDNKEPAEREGRHGGPEEDKKPQEHGKSIGQSRVQTGRGCESVFL